MIRFATSRFGEIQVPEEKIITFKEGIPGFPSSKRFVLLDYKDTPLKWLQSVDEPDVAFIIVEKSYIEPSFQIKLGKEVLNYLEIESLEDVLIFFILRVEDGKVIANFNGPLVFNVNKMLGVQVILDT